ncbi:hypothetical protein EHI8A_011030 [Entamoeba histolytica HM-1:IMSS-B]|uniref:Protein kinase domain-containing protein n=6 Tax=Entamoeba histolytica TaxID=5759 RepID=C4M0N9_ENTH1|nr:hypothetical protein EHI_008750 [Entamoeba histolytica HM-1:IMSS]EMD45648.1 serine/threonine protein kinase, putative [Entamoeba histolytica KU27]EMH75383.1 hypothetical protein EHI8A_011030 [Entamoeba histolytica HM-1:IMSS-B]EMS11445.1 serine-threonine protein kinase, putative [Entamoeba histolytica HM-3:IMSS]ENY65175.1 serine-threonine protein kinase, putative [Entamoeba histolytica HM-1:IMSS-A]GAT94735.1 hypothetical protein CL6EHI_008750 [Entamoeba histolytica]|eukprot:XP_652975.1 hypothetical protein EHI_008750 [Entamoeba histolytica HM-1:IMSS]
MEKNKLVFLLLFIYLSSATLTDISYDSNQELILAISEKQFRRIIVSSIGGNKTQFVFRLEKDGINHQVIIDHKTPFTNLLLIPWNEQSNIIIHNTVYSVIHSTLKYSSKKLDISITSPATFSTNHQLLFACSTNNKIISFTNKFTQNLIYSVNCGIQLISGGTTLATKYNDGSINVFKIESNNLTYIGSPKVTKDKSETYLTDPIHMTIFDTLFVAVTDLNSISIFSLKDQYQHEFIKNDIAFYNTKSLTHYKSSSFNFINSMGNLVIIGIPTLNNNKGGCVMIFDNLLTTKTPRFEQVLTLNATTNTFNGNSFYLTRKNYYMGALIPINSKLSPYNYIYDGCDSYGYCPSGWSYFNHKCYENEGKLSFANDILRIIVTTIVSLTSFVAAFLFIDYIATPAPHLPPSFPLSVTVPDNYSNPIQINLINTSLSQQQVVITVIPNGNVTPSNFSLTPEQSLSIDVSTHESEPSLLIETVKAGTSLHRSHTFVLPSPPQQTIWDVETPLNMVTGTDKEKLLVLLQCAIKLKEYDEKNERHYHGNICPKAFCIVDGVKLLVRELTEGEECYMSPEQVLSQELTEKTDVYSYGIVLNEIINKEKPYGTITNKFDLFERIKDGEKPKIRENLKDELKIIINNCLKNVEERWSLDELVMALQTTYDEMQNNDTFFKEINNSEVVSLLNEEMV